MRWKKNGAWLLALLLLGMLLLAGCAKTDAPKEQSPRGEDAIVLAAYRHLAPGEHDGYYCSKILEVWEPLVTNDEETGRPAPCLAQSWEMFDGGRRWRFHLRRGVRFHDGTEFTADAVLKNMERLEKGVKPSGFYMLNIRNFYPHLVRAYKLDDYTVEFTFSEPNVNQLYNMMNFGSAMYAPSCMDEDGNFSREAIGTGPFKIAENKLGEYVILVRNEDYYGEKARAEKIIVRNIPSADVRFSALKTGEIAGVLDLKAMPPSLAEELKKDGRFTLSVSRSSLVQMLLVNGTKPPFNDVRMRRALSLALDRKTLVDALFLGYAVPTTNLLSNASPFYRELPVPYDLAEAKRLADEVLQGKRCSVRYLLNGADPLQKGEAELIAYWLSEIGLDVHIVPMEYSTMTAELRHGRYEIARSQQGLPNGDPQFIFNAFLLPDGARSKAACLGYRSEEVESLMAQLKTLTDEAERARIFLRLQEISAEDLPVVPLYYDENIVACNKEITGYKALVYGITLSKVERK